MRRTVGSLLALMLLLPQSAGADPWIHELKLGILGHDVPELWSGFRREPRSVDINIEALLSPSFPDLLGGTIRPAIGGSINTAGATSYGYVDLRWLHETPIGIFFSIGLGAAVHNGQLQLVDPNRKALGSRVLFHVPAEIGYRFDARNSLSIYFEHISNAYLASPNEGMDNVGVRYGYRF